MSTERMTRNLAFDKNISDLLVLLSLRFTDKGTIGAIINKPFVDTINTSSVDLHKICISFLKGLRLEALFFSKGTKGRSIA